MGIGLVFSTPIPWDLRSPTYSNPPNSARSRVRNGILPASSNTEGATAS
ncbi:hypothetical protein J0895_07680 [Phormidium pseudopriestleyi FRX01]|uniref:Uncharacterized protein n=1 Tax=Phormidium pseudopriestleyi FRX01 TaxID=1759528 RepID=A0ABS3FPD9_9CYAN|nr:hypothetical protein [Phormidium pseudopriestleyi]MBO0348982.1 hypothetical protein [Phormidium pseudopriestleyi FRX01]